MSDSLDSFYQIKSILIFFFLLLSFSFSSLVICLCSLQEVTLLLYPLCFFFFLLLLSLFHPLFPLLILCYVFINNIFLSLLCSKPETLYKQQQTLAVVSLPLSLIVFSHEILKLEGGKKCHLHQN